MGANGGVKDRGSGLRAGGVPGPLPGIDLVYRGDVHRLKYEFFMRPGADPGRIRLQYEGVESLHVRGDGALEVVTPGGGFTDRATMTYQEIKSEHRTVVTMISTVETPL